MGMPKRLMNRRAFVRLGALAAASAALGISGCGDKNVQRYVDAGELHTDDQHVQGLTVDSERPTYPVTLVAYVDEFCKSQVMSRGQDDVTLLEYFLQRYQSSGDTFANVSIEWRYSSLDELRRIASEGVDDGDLFIAPEDIMQTAVDAGTVYSGTAGTSVRELLKLDQMRLYLARKEGSKVVLPPADTFDGEEIDDGDTLKTQLMELGSFKGKVGIMPQESYQGLMARRALYLAGLYSEKSGTDGSYDKSIRDIIVEYPSVAKMRKAIKNGSCDLGFLFSWDIKDGIEEYYMPRVQEPDTINYFGASLTGSAEGGTARDFLQAVSQSD